MMDVFFLSWMYWVCVFVVFVVDNDKIKWVIVISFRCIGLVVLYVFCFFCGGI